ncbi:MAG: thioredoxin [Spirochaetes bacterium]|nr:thioredoxin [Spirochaetota bacterium]
MGSLADVSDATFENDVLKSTIPVLIDFWAPWCGPCRMQGPIIEKIAQTKTDVKFVKLNTDESPNTAIKYGITGIPTLIIFKNGEPVKKLIGLQSEAQILKELSTI